MKNSDQKHNIVFSWTKTKSNFLFHVKRPCAKAHVERANRIYDFGFVIVRDEN